MNYLFQSIMTKLSGSSLSNYVGGRIYLDEVPESESPVTFPYVTFFIVNNRQDDDFKSKADDILIQFSLFSASSGATEITTMYGYLKAVMDDADLSITGNTCVWCFRENLTTMIDDVLTSSQSDTTTRCRHWAVDYSIMVQD